MDGDCLNRMLVLAHFWIVVVALPHHKRWHDGLERHSTAPLAVSEDMGSCWPMPEQEVQKFNFTDDERSALELVCWNRVLEMNQEFLTEFPDTNGVPDEVTCERTSWWGCFRPTHLRIMDFVMYWVQA